MIWRPYGRPRARPLGVEYDAWLAAQPAHDLAAPRILFPNEGDAFVLVPGTAAQRLRFEIGGPGAGTARAWLNGVALQRSGGDYLWPLRRGSFELRVVAGGRENRVHFSVLSPAPRRHGFTLAASPSGSAETH